LNNKIKYETIITTKSSTGTSSEQQLKKKFIKSVNSKQKMTDVSDYMASVIVGILLHNQLERREQSAPHSTQKLIICIKIINK
jgi:hypothetical protein